MSDIRINDGNQPKITLFQCLNTINGTGAVSPIEPDSYVLNRITIPCSSLATDIYLLRAFEAGADAVVVVACPEGHCRQVQGNIRARKRVARLQQQLEAIGFNRHQLQIFNINQGDDDAVNQAVTQTLDHIRGRGGEIK